MSSHGSSNPQFSRRLVAGLGAVVLAAIALMLAFGFALDWFARQVA